MLRDASMQEKEAGNPLDMASGLPALRRGDLLFWPGHVGVMCDADTLLHANGHHMAVAKEPLSDALTRIAANEYGDLARGEAAGALRGEKRTGVACPQGNATLFNFVFRIFPACGGRGKIHDRSDSRK